MVQGFCVIICFADRREEADLIRRWVVLHQPAIEFIGFDLQYHQPTFHSTIAIKPPEMGEGSGVNGMDDRRG